VGDSGWRDGGKQEVNRARRRMDERTKLMEKYEIYYAVPKKSGKLGKTRRVNYWASLAMCRYELHLHHPTAVILYIYDSYGVLCE
jgi:hypothetical protein